MAKRSTHAVPEIAQDLADHLAANLRHVRDRRGLTQAQLAELCGLPRSTVANLETGAANPTLHVLATLAAALRLGIEELLSRPKSGVELFLAGTQPVKERQGGKARLHELLPHPIPGMAIDRLELAPKARFPGSPHRPGTHEYLVCERGAITLRVAGERLDLNPGDVAAFPGDQPHSYTNPGRDLAIGFSVVTIT